MPKAAKLVNAKAPQQPGMDEALFGFMPTTTVMVSCASKTGRPNIIPVGAWSFACRWPPKITIGICKVSVTPSYFVRASYQMILDTGEFVVNFPDAGMRDQMLLTGSLSANDPTVDKFAAAGLTLGQPLVVKAPTIEECPISIECVVTEQLSLGSHHLFVGEVVAYHQVGDVVAHENVYGVTTITYQPPDSAPSRGPKKRLAWRTLFEMDDVESHE